MAIQSGNQVSTRLSDLPIDPDIMTENIILSSLESNAFIDSGVIVRDPMLDEFLRGPLGGYTISPRFLGPLAQDEPNITNDNPADKSTPKKITGGSNKAVRQSLNQSWSSMDLNFNVLGADPLGVVTSQTGNYWNGVLSRRTVASTIGVINGDLAGDKVLAVDISGESGKDALFNADAFIDAVGTLGDRASTLAAIAMHSVVYNTMVKQQLIEFIPDADGRLVIPTYMGKRVIVDDVLTPVVSSGISTLAEGDDEGGTDTPGSGTGTPGSGTSTSSTTKYYSFLFGAGAIAMGVGAAKVPFEISRDAAAGNGGGEEVIHSRLEWVIHPQGFSFGLNKTPTIAELQDGDNWTMNYERKRIPLAALITAG